MPSIPPSVSGVSPSPLPVLSGDQWKPTWISVGRSGFGAASGELKPFDCSGDVLTCKLPTSRDGDLGSLKLLADEDKSEVWVVADGSMPLRAVWPILRYLDQQGRTSYLTVRRDAAFFAIKVEVGESTPLLFDPRSNLVRDVARDASTKGPATQGGVVDEAPLLAPGVPVHVREAKLDVPPECNGAATKRYARRLIRTLTGCYRDATARGVAKAGDVVLAWNTEPNGVVVNVTLEKNEAGDDSLGECLKIQLGTARFPEHDQSAVTCRMTYHLRMEPAGNEEWVEAGERTKYYPTRFLITSDTIRLQHGPDEPETNIAAGHWDKLLPAAKNSAKSAGYALLVAPETHPIDDIAHIVAVVFAAGFERIVIGKPGNFR